MTSWQTFGHARVKNIFERQMRAGSLAHAYFLSGPEGLGKKALALELAKNILATQNVYNHPDFQILDAEGEITAETTIEFIRGLSFKPFMGAKKVAIINNAHNLNQQSSNSLLKTLEEPSPSTVIILIAGEGKLLPTIISRCQVFHFHDFSKNELQDYAAGKKLKVEGEILDLSFGKISRLLELSKDRDFLKQQSELVAKYQSFDKLTIGERILAVSQYAELEAGDLQKNFLTWMSWQVGNLSESPKDVNKLQALSDALNGLKSNQNKKLVLQGLFLKL